MRGYRALGVPFTPCALPRATWAGRCLATLLSLVVVSRCQRTLTCGPGGEWTPSLWGCVFEDVLVESRIATLLPGFRTSDRNDVLKVHIRAVGAQVVAELYGVSGRGSDTSRVVYGTTTEVAIMLTVATLNGGGPGSSSSSSALLLHLRPLEGNIFLPPLRYTVVVHLHDSATQLAAPEAGLLAALMQQCCPARIAGAALTTWCQRLATVQEGPVGARAGGGLAAAPSDPRGFCSWPETLCARNGSLLKLAIRGGLNCSGGNGAAAAATVAALAAAPSLAWLDLSLSYLGFGLSQLAQLLRRQALQRVALAAADLDGVLDGGDTAAPAEPCQVLAPPGRRLLVLSYNQLSGAVPDCLARHPGLTELRLEGNRNLTATPPDWSAAASLINLDLSTNPNLRGPLAALPPKLVFLNATLTSLGGGVPPLPPSMASLEMAAAGLRGPIGGSWAECRRLCFVELSSNELVGGLPDLPGSLLYLSLQRNSLSGLLPAQLPASLWAFDCSLNRLAGHLPNGNFANAQWLDFSANDFTGPLPAGLSGSPFLIYLNASFNRLDGNLSAFASKWELGDNLLQILDLSHNRLTGPVPDELWGLAAFAPQAPIPVYPRVLDLSYNWMYGNIPEFIYRFLPFAVIPNCQCLPEILLDGGTNTFLCPASISVTPNSRDSLSILWRYPIHCFDPDSGCRLRLAEWISGISSSSRGAGAGGGGGGRWRPRPGACSRAAGVGAASALAPYTWQEIRRMVTLPQDGSSLRVRVSNRSSSGSASWPVANALTLAFALLAASLVIALVSYVCIKGHLARRARQRRRRLRQQLRQERGWALRMAEMELEEQQEQQRQQQQEPDAQPGQQQPPRQEEPPSQQQHHHHQQSQQPQQPPQQHPHVQSGEGGSGGGGQDPGPSGAGGGGGGTLTSPSTAPGEALVADAAAAPVLHDTSTSTTAATTTAPAAPCVRSGATADGSGTTIRMTAAAACGGAAARTYGTAVARRCTCTCGTSRAAGRGASSPCACAGACGGAGCAAAAAAAAAGRAGSGMPASGLGPRPGAEPAGTATADLEGTGWGPGCSGNVVMTLAPEAGGRQMGTSGVAQRRRGPPGEAV